jgi:hypothetical protein
MEKLEKEAMQISKEIVVKFIEIQRVSPGNFEEIFPSVYRVVTDTLLRERPRFRQEFPPVPAHGGKPARSAPTRPSAE